MLSRSRKSITRPRSGVAAVEAAVTLPMVVVLVLGSMEAANAIFLKQSMTIAAYEAVKAASGPNGTVDEAQERCRQMLSSRGVSRFEFQMSPSELTDRTPSGTPITVTVRVRASDAAMGPLNYFSDRTISKTVQMVRLGGGTSTDSG